MNTLQTPAQNGDTLDLTIRFSASIPDLLLSLTNSPQTTTATLKQEIRTHLPDPYIARRIRLIHAGKALEDGVALNIALKRVSSQTPSRASTPLPSAAGKGKAAVRDPPLLSRIYIHCSIGDVILSPTELAAEATLAKQSIQPIHPAVASQDEATPEATTPPPRGFDRLLTAGFSAQEVQNLRLQFLAIQAHTHTPDSMPSPNTLRDMEDRWLDNSSSAAPGQSAGGVGMDEEGSLGQLDDIIWGATMGFFWPVGCMFWAFREEGIWSRRRKMAVVIGFLVNAGLGVVRWMR